MGGYLLVSDEPRHGELIADGMTFTAVVPNRPQLTPRQPALITLTGESVDGIGRMTRAGPAASFKARIRLDEVSPLLCELSWTRVLDEAPEHVRAAVSGALAARGGELDDAAFGELLAVLKRLCPKSGGDIDTVVLLKRRASTASFG